MSEYAKEVNDINKENIASAKTMSETLKKLFSDIKEFSKPN